MTSDGANNFAYDYRNMPIADTIKNGATVLRILKYAYDAATPDNILYFKYDIYGRKLEEGYYSYNWTSISQANADDPLWPATPTTWRKKYTYDGDGTITYSKGQLLKALTNNDTDDPEEVEEKYEYDIFGRLTSKSVRVVDFDNYTYTTYYEYDYSGNVTKIIYPYKAVGGGAQAIMSGPVNAEHLVIENTTLSSDANVTYESGGDIVMTGEFNSNGADVSAKPGANNSEKFALTPVTENVAFQMMAASQSMGTPDPSATVVTYRYNSLGRLTSIGNAGDPDYFAAYTYNPDGSMATEKLKDNTITRSYLYESVGWLKQINDPYITEDIYYTSGGYGGAAYYNGNIAKVVFDYKFAGSPTDYSYLFKYDKIDQLLTADHSINANGDMGIGTENQYDANGNFLTAKVNTVTKTYNYYANTNKVQNTDGSGNDYVYDASGNIISSSPKGIGTLTYDPFIHRTRTISIGASSMNFQYDGTERRIYRKEVVSGVTSEALYLHDGMNAIHERTKTGTVTEYVYGPTGIIAYSSASTWKYVIKDHLGSTRAVVDGTTVTGYDYSAFGSILAPVTPNTNYMYTGQEYDKTSGLHNYKARMYDSDLMRFYGMDPAGELATPFSYVGNNPLVRRDPSGKFIQFAVIAYYAYHAYQAYTIARTAYSLYQGYKYGGLGGLFHGITVAGMSYAAGAAVGGYAGGAGVTLGGSIRSGIASSLTGSLYSSRISGGKANFGLITALNAGIGALGGALSYGSQLHVARQRAIKAGYSDPKKSIEFSKEGLESAIKNSEELQKLHKAAGNSDVRIATPGNLEAVGGSKRIKVYDGNIYDLKDGQMSAGYTGLIQGSGFKTSDGSIGFRTFNLISRSAFASAEKLFLTLGHEFTHSIHYFSGEYVRWGNSQNLDYAHNMSEKAAYTWELNYATTHKWDGYINDIQSALEEYD